MDDLAGMENSLSAFRRATKEGYRYVETDVHATSDDVVVVHHDGELDRTTDRPGLISALPWSMVSTAKIAGREPVARLDAVLEELPDTFFNIDVKSDHAVEPVVATLRRCAAFGRVCLASFSDARLARLRQLGGPTVLTSMGPRSVFGLWLRGRLPGLPAGPAVSDGIAQVPMRYGPLRVVTPALLAAARRLGCEVHVWTIDNEQRMRSLLDAGVDGLVTDRPDILRSVLRSRGSWPDQA